MTCSEGQTSVTEVFHYHRHFPPLSCFLLRVCSPSPPSFCYQSLIFLFFISYLHHSLLLGEITCPWVSVLQKKTKFMYFFFPWMTFPSHENDTDCWISDRFNRTRNETLIWLENENYPWNKLILLFNSTLGKTPDNTFWSCCICEKQNKTKNKPTLDKLAI